MDSIDLEVLHACAAWLRAGLRCEYVTVVRTWGSSPRPQGATMAIREDGQVVGSVSGGCIEDDLIAAVRTHGIVRTQPELITYGISADEAHRFGLPCGGTIQLAVEPLGEHSRIAELLDLAQRRELTRRTLDLDSGAASLDLARIEFVDAYALTGLACFVASAARDGLPVRVVLPEEPDVRSWLSRMHLGDVVDAFDHRSQVGVEPPPGPGADGESRRRPLGHRRAGGLYGAPGEHTVVRRRAGQGGAGGPPG